nr:hypothetical protein [Tanacetum cinerariifolium]
MLNKENYVPWSSHLLRYAKSRPNEKLIHKYIINGLYVRRMIPEPGDTNREVPVNETFHVQIDDELTEKELKQIEADDQAIQTILLDLPKDIYATVDSCETAQEIYIQAKLLNTNQQQSEDFIKPTHQVAQPGMNMGQDRHMQTVRGNDENQFRQYVVQNVGNLNGYNDVGNQVIQHAVQNPRIQNVVQGNGNQNPNGNGTLVAARAEGNATRHNGNQIRCYSCRGKEEAGIQLQAEEFDLMAAAADLDKIEETDKAPVYDSDGSAETERKLLAGRLNMLFRDRRAHAYTRHLMETEARMSREAWVRATDASDLVHEIRELQTADRRRQTVILELLRIDHRRSIEISELRTAL